MNEYNITDIRQLLPRAEIESPRNRPASALLLYSWDLNPMGKGTALTGCQSPNDLIVMVLWGNLLEICPQELARVLPSRALGKVVEEVSPVKQCYKSAWRWWWRLYCCHLCTCGGWLWRSYTRCRSRPSERLRTGTQSPFRLQRLSSSLYWQSLTPCSWQWKIFKGPRSILTEQAKRMNLELRGNNLWRVHRDGEFMIWKSVLGLS